jgi:glutamyl-tRNA reductase
MIVAPGDLHKALADLSSRPHLDEVVVLSTCMRTEVYALVNRFHGAMADVREFFSTWSGQPPEDFSGSLYSYFDEAAVNYLFRVSAGLDSASLGEPEVLGQVRQAWEVAREESTCGPVLGGAFRHALIVGKRARAETAISRGTTSLSHAAQELAASKLGGLQGKQAMVIGLGEVGESAARAFASVPGALPVIVANRTKSRAVEVAEAIGGRVAAWVELPTVLATADVVASCTSGEDTVLSSTSVRAAVAARADRPMLLVDLAVPRDIDPDVTLLNMDNISGFVASKVDGRRAEVPAVERIIAEEVERYSTALAARGVAPLVSTLYERAEEIRAAEMARLEVRTRELGPPERELLETMTRRIVAKLLHEPTVNLKSAAGTARGEALAEAFRELFGLEP